MFEFIKNFSFIKLEIVILESINRKVVIISIVFLFRIVRLGLVFVVSNRRGNIKELDFIVYFV